MKNKIASRVLSMASSGRIPQSVLIEGRDKSLRDDSALFLAAAVVCEGENRPCKTCRHCRKVFSGIHPDVTVTAPKDKHIRVDEIRSLRNDAFILPNEASARVFVIEDADTMNTDAQNALLKLLEEPPENVGLILTASSRSRLLPTVRSRLSAFNIDAESDSENLPLLPSALRLVTCLCEKEGYALLKELTAVTADRTEASAVFFDTRTALVRALTVKNGAVQAEEAVNKAVERLTAEQLVRLCTWCDEAGDRMQANANKTLTAVSLTASASKILGI